MTLTVSFWPETTTAKGMKANNSQYLILELITPFSNNNPNNKNPKIENIYFLLTFIEYNIEMGRVKIYNILITIYLRFLSKKKEECPNTHPETV